MKILGVAFTENEADPDVLTFESDKEAEAYSRGFSDGASRYGAGSAFVILWPPGSDDGWQASEVDEAREAVAMWAAENPGVDYRR